MNEPLRPSISEVVKPAEKGADGCSSQTITLDDFASDSDDDELNATQPPAAVKSEVVAEVATVVDLNGNKECLIGETDRPNSSCTPSDVVPQSASPSEPGDINDEVMEITLQAPFDSVPCELEYSSLVVDPEPDDQKLLILSVSRKAVSSMKLVWNKYCRKSAEKETLCYIRSTRDLLIWRTSFTLAGLNIINLNISTAVCIVYHFYKFIDSPIGTDDGVSGETLLIVAARANNVTSRKWEMMWTSLKTTVANARIF